MPLDPVVEDAGMEPHSTGRVITSSRARLERARDEEIAARNRFFEVSDRLTDIRRR